MTSASAWTRRIAVMALAMAASSVAAAAVDTPSALPFTLKEIGPGVYAAIDGPDGKSGSNAGFVIGDDGVLVVDSFYDPAATTALIGEIHRLTPRPIRYVVNTHYHVDHVGGDAVLRAAGAVIVAHRNERGWVRTENLHLFGDRVSPAIRATVAALALPDITTDTSLTFWLGNRKVAVRAVAGHTGGDLVVDVPDAKVIFCGDILWRRVSPNVIDGTIARWTETLDALSHGPAAAGTTFVPGHGDVAARQDVADFRGYFGDLASIVRQARARHLTGAALVRAALPEMRARYGTWAAFEYFAPLELRFMDEELAGTKRVPQPTGE